MFAVTNIDDIVLLALFFGRVPGRAAAGRIVLGQYLGFAAILLIAAAGSLGATLLPDPVRPYLGLAPIALGLRAGWQAWRERRGTGDTDDESVPTGPGVLTVAGVTVAGGADNLGVYIPVFSAEGPGRTVLYAVVFLVLVGIWCAVGRGLATRPVIARSLSRWGHVVVPVVLIGVGLAILVEGGVFG
ncbi:cadmium resistance transporter [Pseudonocardia acidicola]|nr:cadmium resistance transporter [Pseudonocardia acidicola]